jgi:hypothetical protein
MMRIVPVFRAYSINAVRGESIIRRPALVYETV